MFVMSGSRTRTHVRLSSAARTSVQTSVEMRRRTPHVLQTALARQATRRTTEFLAHGLTFPIQVGRYILFFRFTSAVVVVDSSRMATSSSASLSSFTPPSHFASEHVSTMWFMVCRWPQSQEGDWARPYLCRFERHGPWPIRKPLSGDHVWWGKSKPGCLILGSVTIYWLTTEVDDQSSLHCVVVSTGAMPDHTGCQDASHGGGCSKTSVCMGQFGWASMIWNMLSVSILWRREGDVTLVSTVLVAMRPA